MRHRNGPAVSRHDFRKDSKCKNANEMHQLRLPYKNEFLVKKKKKSVTVLADVLETIVINKSEECIFSYLDL